jgi:hypothetical protein
VADAENNDIKGAGCRHLSKAHWPKLKEIHLSNNVVTQGVTKLTSRAPRVSAGPSGSMEQTFTYVTERRGRDQPHRQIGLLDFGKSPVEGSL